MDSVKAPPNVLYAHNVIIRNVKVVNGVHTLEEAATLTPLRECTVSFANGRVVDVGDNVDRVAGATVVDGSDMYLIPGLIDLQLNDMAWFDKVFFPCCCFVDHSVGLALG
jgi:N-acyl-D-aspartate/D-glutamate deacylase